MGELKEMNDKTAPAKRPFSQIAVVIFALVFLVHFLRLVFGWEIHLTRKFHKKSIADMLIC